MRQGTRDFIDDYEVSFLQIPGCHLLVITLHFSNYNLTKSHDLMVIT